jgi:hypothetical protein
MKKTFALLACALTMLLLLPSSALAETTEPTDQPGEPLGLTFTLTEPTAVYAYRLTDAYVSSRVSFKQEDVITIVPETQAQLLLLNWYDAPASYTVTQLGAAGNTITEETITDRELGRQIALEDGCKSVAVLFNENGSLGGVAAYADASFAPAAFSPAPATCDLLIITAEPGMEWMQFGAVIPTYTKEKNVKTGVLYISDYGKRARAYEALSGLQTAGYSTYPMFAGYQSDSYDDYKTTAAQFDRRAFVEYLKEQINALSPKVIVTHGVADVSGAHSLVAECVQIAVSECPSVQKLYCFGATEGSSPTVIDMNQPLVAYAGKTAAEIAQTAYEQHVSRKLFGLTIDSTSAYTLAYSTVGEDEQKNDLLEHMILDSLQSYMQATPAPTATPAPQAAGATAAPEAQGTQEESMPVANPDKTTGFGELLSIPALILIGAGAALSTVMFVLLYKKFAAARGKGDAVCFCLIPVALGLAAGAILAGSKTEAKPAEPEQTYTMALATPVPSETPEAGETPAQEPTPEPTPQPDPDAQYYRQPGEPAEVIVVDVANGHWEYRSDDLGISIDRVKATNPDGKPLTYFVADIHMKDITQFRPGFGSEAHTGRGAIHPWLIARREKAVLWLTGDNLINDERELKGILIRDGRMFWSAEKEDTLAIYPDMSMRIIKKLAMSPGALLEDGVDNAYSFGPTLIDNGVINEKAKYHRVRRANPRAGIGYLSPGHYIAIVVDGRQKDYSVGMPVWEFADLFASYGCSIAYNLDGGLSAAMIFMGEQINTHSGQRTGDKNDVSYQRAVPDGLMFGYSLQVPSVDDPVINDGNNGNNGN